MTDTVAVLGAGSWGTALAHALARSGRDVRLWARRPELAEAVVRTRTNPPYFAGVLDPRVLVCAAMEQAMDSAAIAVLAVPTHSMREVAGAMTPPLPPDCIVVSAAKGFELSTGKRMTEVLREVLPADHSGRVAVLSGPNIAPEIAAGLPAATVVASEDVRVAERVRDLCNSNQLRFYSARDVVGVEFGGALKNVIAIAAGVCDGIGAGDNGKAAIITRGLAEMARLGVAAGAQPLTFAGLTGIGDCVVTCMSRHSRNRRLGEALARGGAESLLAGPMVVEGVNVTRVSLDIARAHGVEVPLAAAVHAVLFSGKRVEDAIADLMSRDTADELRGLDDRGHR